MQIECGSGELDSFVAVYHLPRCVAAKSYGGNNAVAPMVLKRVDARLIIEATSRSRCAWGRPTGLAAASEWAVRHLMKS